MCNCGTPWMGVTPPPPCPVHSVQCHCCHCHCCQSHNHQHTWTSNAIHFTGDQDVLQALTERYVTSSEREGGPVDGD